MVPDVVVDIMTARSTTAMRAPACVSTNDIIPPPAPEPTITTSNTSLMVFSNAGSRLDGVFIT
jgi:hypothetical protein